MRRKHIFSSRLFQCVCLLTILQFISKSIWPRIYDNQFLSECTFYVQVESAVIGNFSANPDVVEHVRNNLLWQPSLLPYNLHNKTRKYFFETVEGTASVIEALFHNKKNGVFVEAGAYDGESYSMSLYMEKYLGWGGLLVEPNTQLLRKLKRKNRKAFVYPGCLSLKSYPEKVKFVELELVGHVQGSMNRIMKDALFYTCNTSKDIPNIHKIQKNIVDTESGRSLKNCSRAEHFTEATCIPLETLLLATNLHSIDFLSLDAEGAEVDILKYFPFNKFDIKVIRVEVMAVNSDTVRKILKASNQYLELVTYKGESIVEKVIPGDLWFIKEDMIVGPKFTTARL